MSRRAKIFVSLTLTAIAITFGVIAVTRHEDFKMWDRSDAHGARVFHEGNDGEVKAAMAEFGISLEEREIFFVAMADSQVRHGYDRQLWVRLFAINAMGEL